MSKTEERLTEALHASANRVRDDRLRSFPELEPGARRQRSWPVWLIPVAAAASVALIIGLAVAVTGGPRQTGPGPASGSGATTAAFPKYFAKDTYLGGTAGDVVQVLSTSTGSVVASARTPTVAGWSLTIEAVAAGPGARTFYLSYTAARDVKSSTAKILIYRLSITSTGAAVPLTPIKGGAITVVYTPWLGGPSGLAVSPDGRKLAVTNQNGQGAQDEADQIVVIDMPTGAQHAWHGGLYRSGATVSIPQISWTADSRSLVFLAVWCAIPRQSPGCAGPTASEGSRDAQVRSIDVATGGGTLDHSVVLLAQSARYPLIATAVAGPGPAELDVVLLYGTMSSDGSWSNAEVKRVSAVNGALLGVAYRWVRHGKEGLSVGLNSDPSGHYLVFIYYGIRSYYTGWIAGGKLHLLPIKQPRYENAIIAW